MGKIRDNCAYCKKPYTTEEMAERIRKKRDNAIASRAKALANGNKVQRKKKADPVKIAALRANGKSVAFIAGCLNVSQSAVYKTLKESQ